jgi:hypothetical protein
MNPEERLEALRDDARWNPIRLYPEHGRMPAPVRPRPWRVLAGAGAVLVAVAGVFAGVSLARSLGDRAAPMPYAATPTLVTPARPSPAATLSGAELLATAELPPPATPGRTDSVGSAIGNSGEICGMTSIGASFWTVPGMSVADAITWLGQNRPKGMLNGTNVQQDAAAATALSGFSLAVADSASRQGLLYSVVSPRGMSTTIRIDAVTLPEGAGCVLAQLQETSAKQRSAAQPSASQ